MYAVHLDGRDTVGISTVPVPAICAEGRIIYALRAVRTGIAECLQFPYGFVHFGFQHSPADKIGLAEELAYEFQCPFVHYGIEDGFFSGKGVDIIFSFLLIALVCTPSYFKETILGKAFIPLAASLVIGYLGCHEEDICISHVDRLHTVVLTSRIRMSLHPLETVFAEIPVGYTCRIRF